MMGAAVVAVIFGGVIYFCSHCIMSFISCHCIMVLVATVCTHCHTGGRFSILPPAHAESACHAVLMCGLCTFSPSL